MNLIFFVALILPLIPDLSSGVPIHSILLPETELAHLNGTKTTESNCVIDDAVPEKTNKSVSYSEELFKKFQNIEQLIITKLLTLKTWKKEDFAGDNQLLQYIEINNTVLDVSASIFGNVPELKEFVVKNSKINEIEPTAFGAASKLETMKFENDSLSSLPADLFDGLTNLKKVFLTYNNFEDIEAINFSEKNEIQWVDLAYNKITQLTDKSLDKLTNLNFLVLVANQIDQIQPNTFVKLSKLKLLDLSFNKLEQITKTMFDGIGENLRHFDLAHNKLKSIDADAISGFKHLETLILSYNRLTTLNSSTFAGLYNLQYLDLSINEIQEIDPNLFKDLINLERFDMNYGKLKSFDLNILNYTPNLKYIDILSNYITQLTKYVPNANISSMRADNNATVIKSPRLSKEEQKFYDEFVMRLRGREDVLFLPFHLETLDVPDNELIGDNKLLLIDMRDNRVHALDKHFFEHLKNFRKFIMSRNPIKLDYETLNEATKLEYLMLIECHFRSIDFDKLSHLSNLKHLFLGGNALHHINISAESRFESLEELDMEFNHNEFRTFSLKKDNFPKLKKLQIVNRFTKCDFVKRLRESKEFDNVDVDVFKLDVYKSC